MTSDLPEIVDAHVHLWDPERFRYPWLDEIPSLRRPMLPADYSLAGRQGQAIKFIFVECGCIPSQNIEEVDWITALEKTEPRLKGVIAHSSLERAASAREELELLAARPLVKGVRRNLQAEPRDFLENPDFIKGLKLLPEFGFTFDLCIRSDQLPAAVDLVRRIPEVTFVLDHFGKPSVRNGSFEPWARNLRLFATAPNVLCKISGLATEADWTRWKISDLQPYFDHALGCFGPQRVLFGSDWPVSTLATSYDRWIETVLELTLSANEQERVELFQTNAERIYRV